MGCVKEKIGLAQRKFRAFAASGWIVDCRRCHTTFLSDEPDGSTTERTPCVRHPACACYPSGSAESPGWISKSG